MRQPPPCSSDKGGPSIVEITYAKREYATPTPG
jgi:hypothetical protein